MPEGLHLVLARWGLFMLCTAHCSLLSSTQIRFDPEPYALAPQVFTGHRDAVLCMAIGYLETGMYVVSGSDDHSARVWDIDV